MSDVRFAQASAAYRDALVAYLEDPRWPVPLAAATARAARDLFIHTEDRFDLKSSAPMREGMQLCASRSLSMPTSAPSRRTGARRKRRPKPRRLKRNNRSYATNRRRPLYRGSCPIRSARALGVSSSRKSARGRRSWGGGYALRRSTWPLGRGSAPAFPCRRFGTWRG